jgi:PAS domain S-box-containing protein
LSHNNEVIAQGRSLAVDRLEAELEQALVALEDARGEAATLARECDAKDAEIRTLRSQLASHHEHLARRAVTADEAHVKLKIFLADIVSHSSEEQTRREEMRMLLEQLQDTTEALEEANTALAHLNTGLQQAVQERTAELEVMNAALSAREEQLRTLIMGIPQLVWRSHDGGQWTWSSPQWLDYTGQVFEQAAELGWLQAIHPEDRERTMAAWDNAAASGGIHVEHRIWHAAADAWIWHRTRSAPVREEGRVVEWLGTSTEVQQLKELQAHQEVLVAELQHRTRNLIGVVRALADRTLAGSASLDDFKIRFRARLGSLGRVQGLLSRLETGDRVTFGDLLRMELASLGALEGGKSRRVTLEGPEAVRLRSASVQILALGLHELATNALKYGALSQEGSHLAVLWRFTQEDDAPWLEVDWHETGVQIVLGPDGTPPRRGFGRELIERALRYQLGAKTRYEIEPGRVRCTIKIPMFEKETGQNPFLLCHPGADRPQ